MQFRPYDRIAPVRDFTKYFLLCRHLPIDGGYLFVSRHNMKGFHSRQVVGAVHIAPPEYRFDTVHQGHTTMIMQHGPQLRVYPALNAVVGRRVVSVFEISKQHVLRQQLAQAAPGPIQAVMCIESMAMIVVDFFL